jgi:hypothetical protein
MRTPVFTMNFQLQQKAGIVKTHDNQNCYTWTQIASGQDRRKEKIPSGGCLALRKLMSAVLYKQKHA